jgi:hypothetical protein
MESLAIFVLLTADTMRSSRTMLTNCCPVTVGRTWTFNAQGELSVDVAK